MGSPQFSPRIGTENGVPPWPEAHIRDLIAKVLKRCSKLKDRQRVAVELNTLTHLGVTKNMLDDWASPSKKGLRFPASLVAGFCEVTGSDELARFVMGPRLRELVELGERVTSMGWILGKMQDELARLTTRGLQKKGKRNRPGKT